MAGLRLVGLPRVRTGWGGPGKQVSPTTGRTGLGPAAAHLGLGPGREGPRCLAATPLGSAAAPAASSPPAAPRASAAGAPGGPGSPPGTGAAPPRRSAAAGPAPAPGCSVGPGGGCSERHRNSPADGGVRATQQPDPEPGGEGLRWTLPSHPKGLGRRATRHTTGRDPRAQAAPRPSSRAEKGRTAPGARAARPHRPLPLRAGCALGWPSAHGGLNPMSSLEVPALPVLAQARLP